MKKLIITLLILFPCITLGVTFNRSLKVTLKGNDVLELQKILKQEFPSYQNDWMTGYFGNITKRYVIKLQDKYKEEILTPYNLNKGTGFVGNSTVGFLNNYSGNYSNNTSESLDIKCIANKSKVKLGDSVIFYILKNSGSEPFVHYWNNEQGPFYKQVTINNEQDAQMPVTVIDANNNQASIICSVALDQIKYSTIMGEEKRNLVCGKDGITYLNQKLATEKGAEIECTGACPCGSNNQEGVVTIEVVLTSPPTTITTVPKKQKAIKKEITLSEIVKKSIQDLQNWCILRMYRWDPKLNTCFAMHGNSSSSSAVWFSWKEK